MVIYHWITFIQDIVIDSPPKEQPDEYLGKLNFGLAFDKESNTLAIHVIQGADLPAMDITGLPPANFS